MRNFYTGGSTTEQQQHELICLVPHPRTLRKARLQVQLMVNSGFSAFRIRGYLHRYVLWWVNVTDTWQYQELLQWFIEACWQEEVAAYAVHLSPWPYPQVN